MTFKRGISIFFFLFLFCTLSYSNVYLQSFITIHGEGSFNFYQSSEKAEKVEMVMYKITLQEMIRYFKDGKLPFSWFNKPFLKKIWNVEGKKWNSIRVNTDKLDYGIYMVIVKSDEDTAISILSKTRILGKIIYLEDSAFLKFYDIITGEFLKDTTIYALDQDGEVEVIGKTDSKGEIVIEKENNEGKLIFIEYEGALFSFLDWPYYFENNHTLSFFTDRPIYKPGDTIKFGGIIREKSDNNQTKVPAGKKIRIEITDSNDRKFYDKELQLDDFGIFEDSFETFQEIKRGSYSVKITVDDSSFWRTFRIEDYVKPKFEVKLFGKERFKAENLAKFKVVAKYYYGSPLNNVDFGYTVYMLKNYEKVFYDSGIARLNSNGEAEIPIQFSDITTPTKFVISVKISDESGAEVEEEKEFTVYPYDFYVESEYDFYVKLGEKFQLDLSVKDLNSTPVSTDLLILIKSDSTTSLRVLAKSDENGKAFFEYLPNKSGRYEFEIWTLGEKKARLFKGNFLVYKSYYQTVLKEQFRINLLSEKIIPGNFLTLELFAPFEELSAKLVIFADNWTKFLDVDFKDGKALIKQLLPDEILSNNISILVFAAKAGRKLELYRSYGISKEALTFELEIKTDKEIYLPGKEVQLSIVSEEKEAEFFAAIVDKAVLDLTGLENFWLQEIQRIYDYYSGRVFRDFESYSWELREFFSLMTDEKAQELLAQIKSSGVALRSNFNDTALWFPKLRTAKNGKATVRFKLPDNLTTWKILVVGINKEGKYGYNDKEIRTTKDIVLTPILPEYLLEKDVVNIGMMINNNTEEGQNFELLCQADEYEFYDDLFVPENSRGVINFVYEVPSNESKVSFKMIAESTSTGLGDGVVVSREIKPLVFVKNSKRSGVLNNQTNQIDLPSGKFNGVLSISSDILGMLVDSIEQLVGYPYGCVEQTMSKFLPTIIYKKLLRKSQRDFVVSMASEEIDKMIESSLKRLYSFQHSDGGWGWWKNDDTSSFMTAYVLHGFHIAIKEGYKINEDVLKEGLNALKKLLTEKDDSFFYYMLYVLSIYGKNSLKQITLKDIEKDYEKVLYLLVQLRTSTEKEPIFKNLLEKAGNYDHIKLDETPYFLDEVQLNALVLQELFSIEKPTDEIAKFRELLTNYLINKRVGRTWKNTKQSAFCVLALSNLNLTTQNGVYAEIKINSTEKFKGKITGILQIPVEAENVSIYMNTDEILFWGLDGGMPIPLETYKPISSKFAMKREIQKRTKVKIDKQDISVFVPIKNRFVVESIETIKAPVSEATVSHFYLNNMNSNAFILPDGSLIFNNEYTGLKLKGGLIELDEDSLTILGSIFRDNIQLTDKGIYKLKFTENSPIKIGDILRSQIKFFGSGDYIVVEDPIPSAAIPIRNYRERVLRKFFTDDFRYSEKELRKDGTLIFLQRMQNHVLYNYYRIMLSGKFTILPAKAWEMYEPENLVSSEIETIEVEF
jgi:hypothetical protein